MVIDEKNKMNKASLRDQRKNKNQDIIKAKKKYQNYLTSYAKGNGIEKRRKEALKEKSQNARDGSG